MGVTLGALRPAPIGFRALLEANATPPKRRKNHRNAEFGMKISSFSFPIPNSEFRIWNGHCSKAQIVLNNKQRG